jgi:cell fate regulator YaaT (PSP1 superfamily)
MPIFPLPQFEADLKEHLDAEDKKAYEAMQPPKTVVVRFGAMKLIGEFPYDLKVKPGCGSKLVVRTFRGTELGEMLTSTCPNSGCSKSVSRQDMLKYIENSGGKDYPFFTDGRVVRVATTEDLNAQQAIEQSKHDLNVRARGVLARMNANVKIVEVEPVLGGERLTAYYLSEHRLELHHVARELSAEFGVRVDMKQVGARDEARLIADYEKCGQYCCCKNFLKVLKPVSMKAAKTQKATLEPLKISGRCGRLMCCLRYEESTYDSLKASLPKRKTRVGTPEGDGTVIDGQILTQLVLVELDDLDPSGQIRQVAVAVEELSEVKNKVMPPRPQYDGPPMRGGPGGPRPMGPRREGGPGGPPMGGGPGAPTQGQRPPRRDGPGGGAGAGQGPSRDDRGPRRQDGPRPMGPNQKPSRNPTPPPPRPASTPPAAQADEVMFDESGNEIQRERGPGGPDGQGGGDDRRRRRRRRGRGGPPGGTGGGSPAGPADTPR